jgi:hypothetical protein
MDIHTDDYKQYYTTAGNPVLWMYDFPPFSPSIHYVRQQSVDRSREHALVELKALSAIEARATAAEARIEVLEKALRKYMAATPEHDYSCGVGPRYRCTCDLHEANEAARQALKGSTDG